ncbi:hypothetical protein [Pseudomonas phage vB_PaS-HSN4]|nr:hypothetical protein [Pseudomonas phage vB_PaS-HSN4]
MARLHPLLASDLTGVGVQVADSPEGVQDGKDQEASTHGVHQGVSRGQHLGYYPEDAYPCGDSLDEFLTILLLT